MQCCPSLLLVTLLLILVSCHVRFALGGVCSGQQDPEDDDYPSAGLMRSARGGNHGGPIAYLSTHSAMMAAIEKFDGDANIRCPNNVVIPINKTLSPEGCITDDVLDAVPESAAKAIVEAMYNGGKPIGESQFLTPHTNDSNEICTMARNVQTVKEYLLNISEVKGNCALNWAVDHMVGKVVAYMTKAIEANRANPQLYFKARDQVKAVLAVFYEFAEQLQSKIADDYLERNSSENTTALERLENMTIGKTAYVIPLDEKQFVRLDEMLGRTVKRSHQSLRVKLP